MKVLLIDVNCKSSSTGKIVYDLYSGLNSGQYGEDFEAAVCYGRGDRIDEPGIYKFGIDIETNFHAAMTRITGLMGYYSHFSTKRLIDFIEKFQPDLIHIHELHAYFVNIITLLKYLKSKKIKTVWTFHCDYMYTGNCGYAYECEKWKTGCGGCDKLRDYPKSLFFDFTKKMWNDKKRVLEDYENLTIVTPSPWLRDRVKQSFLSDKDVRVVYNGIDISTFHPTEDEKLRNSIAQNGEKIALAVAPYLMAERKGGKYVIELADKMRNEKIKFVMIGVDEPIADLPPNVITMPVIKDQKLLAKYYSLADVCVTASKREVFPTVVLESFCCGTPVVGFQAGGTVSFEKWEFARFVPHGDTDQLATRVKEILEAGFSRDYIATQAHNEYAKEIMIKNYIDLYKSC